MAKLLANEKAIHLAKSKHEDLLIDQGTLATPGGSIWIAKAMLGNDAVIMVVNLDSKQVLLVPETITFQYWCKNNILMDLPEEKEGQNGEKERYGVIQRRASTQS